jgi:hypothetical protein
MVFTTALVVSVSTLVAPGAQAGAQSSDEAPKATDVGITADEIHVAVVADVDNPFAPNIFKGSVDAVKGAAKFLNSKAGGGGLAGRTVVVDFYDSELNMNATTNAQIQACQNDVAMVGTSAAFLTSVENMRNCPDANGAITGLPDIPFVTSGLAHQCSDQSFPIATPGIICATKDEHPQTYQPNVGRGYYYKQKFGPDVHGVYEFANVSKAAHDATFVSGVGQVRIVCCKSDKDVDISGTPTQSSFTPVIQDMKNVGANYGQAADANSMVLMRKEAALQGLTGVKVWDCASSCYNEAFLRQGGQDVEGQYVDAIFLPFLSKAEQKANPMLANFVKYTGTDRVDGYGIDAWAAMIAFRDAVNYAVQHDGGVNGVTRKTIFDGLNQIHSFSAEGMIGTIDLAGRKTTPCHVLTQVKDGKFERLYPSEPGTFDCAKKNVRKVKLDLY